MKHTCFLLVPNAIQINGKSQHKKQRYCQTKSQFKSENLAKTLNLPFFQVSSTTGMNVDSVFTELALHAIQTKIFEAVRSLELSNQSE